MHIKISKVCLNCAVVLFETGAKNKFNSVAFKKWVEKTMGT